MQDWPIDIFKVVDCVLDSKNIRLPSAESSVSQEDIIEDLFINEDAKRLVETICAEGLHPHELPIVVREGNDVIVLEGNRRFAAMKCLINPSILPNYRKWIEQIVEKHQVQPIEFVRVLVAPSRAEADRLIASIHTRNSRRPWKPLRQSYFYYSKVESGKMSIAELIAAYPNQNIRAHIRRWSLHRMALASDLDESTLSAAKGRSFPISTLERLADNVDFQEALGLSISEEGQVFTALRDSEFKKHFGNVVSDIVSKRVDSRTLSKAEDIKGYVAGIHKSTANSVRQETTTAAGDLPITESSGPAHKSSSKSLVPGDLLCNLPSPGLERMLTELKTINCRKFPNAAHDLLRSFLEQTIKVYLTELTGELKDKKGGFVTLATVLEHAETHFTTYGPKGLVQVLKVLCNPNLDYLYSADFMNAVNHNPDVFSDETTVRNSWDRMEPLFRHMLKGSPEYPDVDNDSP